MDDRHDQERGTADGAGERESDRALDAAGSDPSSQDAPIDRRTVPLQRQGGGDVVIGQEVQAPHNLVGGGRDPSLDREPWGPAPGIDPATREAIEEDRAQRTPTGGQAGQTTAVEAVESVSQEVAASGAIAGSAEDDPDEIGRHGEVSRRGEAATDG